MDIHEDILLVDVDDVTQPFFLVLSGVDRLNDNELGINTIRTRHFQRSP